MSNRRNKRSRSGNPAKAAAHQSGPATKARMTQRVRPEMRRAAATAPVSRSRASRTRRALAAWWSAQLGRLLEWEWSPPQSRAALADRDRTDVLWAIGTGLISAVLFATSLSSHPGLSDASEAVAGISSLGILHAPGYPSYVLVARAFTWLIPFGDLTLRVGLFSLVCAAVSIGIVQLLARRMGAARWAASLGALCLAASASYWFYATYTKHDMFSGLCFAVSLYLLLSWQSRPSTGRLVGLAAAVGIGLGSSWPLEIMIIPAGVLVLILDWRRLSLPSLALAAAVGAVLIAGSYGFVLVRAGENPAVNWGSASSLGRLEQLIDRSNFSGAADNAGGGGAGLIRRGPERSGQAPQVAHAVDTRLGTASYAAAADGDNVQSAFNYLVIFWRELGPAGLLLVAWGALASLLWRRRRWSWPLLIVFLADFAATLKTAGIHVSQTTYADDLIEEGFLLGCLFVMACWLSVGLTDLVGFARRAAGRVDLARGGWVVPAVGVALAAVVLAPRASADWSVAHRGDNAYADDWAMTVFSELPHHAVLFLAGSDLNLPLTYQQVVDGRRRDVLIVSLGGMRFGWYQQQIDRQLGYDLPAGTYTTRADWIAAMRAIRGRPVYLDEQAADDLRSGVPVESEGLVLRLLAPGAKSRNDGQILETRLLAAERSAGFPSADWNAWPNQYLNLAEYADSGLRAAGDFYAEHDLAGMAQALQNVIRIDPGNAAARRDLAELAEQRGGQL